jgi:TonB-dependent receptor
MAIGAFRFRASLVCVIGVIFSLTIQSLYASGSGSIKGHVFDKGTSEPLIGANVVVLNTSLGAAANVDGLITIYGVPAGEQTLKVSYIGYQTITVQVTVPENGILEQEFRLRPEAIEEKEVVVTVQARGQNAAINQQITSDRISNVVSSARIQALPDANAAESIGRLPGVSLVRSGGEAKQVVIRGLEPKYNSITIDGISLPSTNSGDRGTDLSMISSTSLEGIQIFKTVTPDMDAGAIGGSVNFDIRHAKSGAEDEPSFSFSAEGGYRGLVYSLGDYKFVASTEKRFFDDKFGVFVQGIIQRQNLTNDQMSATYSNSGIAFDTYIDSIQMYSTSLSFIKSIQKRYDATITLDYKLPDGEISFLNLVSQGKTNSDTYSETYPTVAQNGNIFFGAQRETFDLHVVSNILSYKQSFGSYSIHAKLAHAYSDNIAPYSWYTNFTSSTSTTVPFNLVPSAAVKAGQNQVDVTNMQWTTLSGWNSFTKQDDRQMSLDIEKKFNLSDLISANVKIGGAYKYTTRYYNYDQADGIMNIGPSSTQATVRAYLATQLPFLSYAPINWDATGASKVGYFGFADRDVNFGNYINGKYSMKSAANIDVLDAVMHVLKNYRAGTTSSPAQPVFDPNYVESRYQDYSGHEIRTAGYIMATVNVGSWLTVIPGVRYQELKTSYSALHFNNYLVTNTSQSYPDSSVTAENTYRYWLPDVSVKIIPSEVVDFRLAYTSTLSYPDYQSFVPIWAYNASFYTMHWKNTGLLPERSQNYDAQISYHNNYVGLFAVGGFLKQIDNEIYDPGPVYLSRATAQSYPFKDLFTASLCTLYTYINNPYRVKVWGIETEWQTNFWYLPVPFNNLVLNVNYTHIFSDGTFKKTFMKGARVKVPVDTLYTDKLFQQPSDVVNLSIGYDYEKFSILVSMIYQSKVFNKPDFFWTLRSDKAKYLRWDLVIKQGLPWLNMEVYCNMNDINNETDLYLIRKHDLPTSENSYGFTASFGVRWSF